MKTTFRNLHYISVTGLEGEHLISVVWGLVVYDERMKFPVNGNVTSSAVISADLEKGHFITQSGTTYIATDGITQMTMPWSDFIWLRAGFDPDHILIMRQMEREGFGHFYMLSDDEEDLP